MICCTNFSSQHEGTSVSMCRVSQYHLDHIEPLICDLIIPPHSASWSICNEDHMDINRRSTTPLRFPQLTLFIEHETTCQHLPGNCYVISLTLFFRLSLVQGTIVWSVEVFSGRWRDHVLG